MEHFFCKILKQSASVESLDDYFWGKYKATHPCSKYMPLPVVFVRVEVNLIHVIGQVHLSRLVRPGAECQGTLLLIKRIKRDINLTHGLEHTWIENRD